MSKNSLLYIDVNEISCNNLHNIKMASVTIDPSVGQPVIWNHNIYATCSMGVLGVIFYCFYARSILICCPCGAIINLLYACWSLLLVSNIYAINLWQWYGVICWYHGNMSPGLIFEILWIFLCFNFLILIESGHNYAHAMTAELSWHVQNSDLIL